MIISVTVAGLNLDVECTTSSLLRDSDEVFIQSVGCGDDDASFLMKSTLREDIEQAVYQGYVDQLAESAVCATDAAREARRYDAVCA